MNKLEKVVNLMIKYPNVSKAYAQTIIFCIGFYFLAKKFGWKNMVAVVSVGGAVLEFSKLSQQNDFLNEYEAFLYNLLDDE